MKIVFMGSPQFAADILREISEGFEIAAVFTQPDRVRGRGKGLIPTPVKSMAQSLGLDVFSPSSLKDEGVMDILDALAPDVICVAAYGALLPKRVLDLPPLGCINVHASILPRWRGAAPIERAIIAGDEYVGVSIMRMEEGLDTGDYCVVRRIEVGEKNAGEITSELAMIGASALIAALNLIETDSVKWTEQDPDKATYAEKIKKGELDLKPGNSSITNLRLAKASSPSHPSRIMINGRIVAVEGVSALDDLSASRLSEVLHEYDASDPMGIALVVDDRLFLGSSDGFMEITQLKPAGKNSMDAQAYLRGAKLKDIDRWSSL